MNNKRKIKIFIFVLVFIAAIFYFWVINTPLKKPASGELKNGQQDLFFEENKISRVLWNSYALEIMHQEYLKIKKIILSAFQKNTSFNNYSDSPYLLHEDISTTYFWVGEDRDTDNHNISNTASCWDDNWLKHFGGVDDPRKRNGYFPAEFIPKENPFYFALPYNDFDSNGNRKKGIAAYIPWYKEKKWSDNESVCKNRWIKIIKGDKVAYAQWEDAGPFGEDDINYVFGTSQPKNKLNNHAGLDVSPAVRDYLELSDIDKTSWQFVNASEVPPGPWKNIITSSNVSWAE